MRQDDDGTHIRTARLTVPQAANALGISAEAVRARIKRGTLKVERDGDGTVFVLLDTDRMRQDGDGTLDGTGVRALLEAKDETIAALRDQLARAEERDRENRRLLAAALERIPAIEAPASDASQSSEPRESAVSNFETESKGAVPQDAADGEIKPSFWRRIFGG